ncbi:DUF1353 domain-containing protein [Devosia sp. XGJD_8]|jgi:hypothetical protein|uniref:DUF1353 domain-containing protein n=1 Tax=Devosia sp. XGJD_8 TaxID=3391187 RepID=UPI00398535DC
MAGAEKVDRFGGKLVLVLLDNKIAPSIKEGRSLWGMHDPLTYHPGDRQHTITVPAGFVTDLASVPRWAWILIPPDGPWVKAAIIHDYLYSTGGTGKWKKHPPSITRPQPYSRLEADRIMEEAMENRGVGWFARRLIYAAVRLGGSGGWRENRAAMVSEATERYVTGA